jgi:ribosomal protein S18 acetylase RimI-like enzyme
MTARIATADDVEELLRLRTVLLRDFHRGPWDDDWLPPARQLLASQLADPSPTMAAFVVDRPAGDGLAACAVGTIEHRLGAPGNPGGRSGYVYNVATDPDMRRRGYSRACMTGLLGWFEAQGVPRITLMATKDGEPLYESLGFARTADPAMRVSRAG